MAEILSKTASKTATRTSRLRRVRDAMRQPPPAGWIPKFMDRVIIPRSHERTSAAIVVAVFGEIVRVRIGDRGGTTDLLLSNTRPDPDYPMK